MTSTTLAARKRQHIVETAYRLFRRNGFHAVGIDRIIAEADVAKMTMYRHFPCKDALIVAVLDWRAKRFEEQLDGLAESARTPERKIATIFDWHERWFASADFHGCLFQHALAEFGEAGNPIYDAVTRQKNGLKDRMRDILSAALPKARATAAADALYMLLEGATLLAQMGQARTAMKAARGAAASILDAAARR